MRAATRHRIQAAKAQADHLGTRAGQKESDDTCPDLVAPFVVEEMMHQPKWWTFMEIKETFAVSYDTVSRAFRGRDGVAKFGSDYRVSDVAVRHWLRESLAQGRNAS
jgi:hypothetical protein